MCGSTSAVGLAEQERALWPFLRERLRVPGQLMGLMRGVLGGDAEVAAVVTTTPGGVARPVAILATPLIAAEIELVDGDVRGDVQRGRIGTGDDRRPVAIFTTDWIREHLSLYARELWHRPRGR
ncbi:MAG TPA: hypothetical protein VE547_01390 [Mycobacteriales bacterium]|nr:hypothetical protein [Mycobacteriales bacterium]